MPPNSELRPIRIVQEVPLETMWAELDQMAVAREGEIATFDQTAFSHAHAQVLADLTSIREAAKQESPLEIVDKAVETTLARPAAIAAGLATMNLIAPLPVRILFKLEAAAVARLILGDSPQGQTLKPPASPGRESLTSSENPYLKAKAAEGLAWQLLMEVKTIFGETMANDIANAYHHVSKRVLGNAITQTDEKRKIALCQEATKTFERLADSMLKLGAVRALNKILEEKDLTFDWRDIRTVINDVILNPRQIPTGVERIAIFEKRFLNSNLGVYAPLWNGPGYEPEKWVWRVLAGPDGADIFEGTTTLEGPINRLKPGSKGEIIMAKKIEGREWYETPRSENIPGDATDWWWGLFPPDRVFVEADKVTPSYP